MRILYSHRIQSRDGQSVHIEEIVAALRQAGHEVLVVGPALYRKADFGGESRLLAWLRQSLPRWVQELAELGYNVPAVLRLLRAGRLFVPDMVYERYNLHHLAGAIACRCLGVPLLLEVNSPLFEERAQYGGLGLPRLARTVQTLTWRSADRLFVVTDVLKQIVIAAGVPSSRIRVVPNGIDLDGFAGRPDRPHHSAMVTIGFIGFVRQWHGLDQVIAGLAAVNRTTPVRLVIAGEGPARPALERQAAELGVAGLVHFTGLQPRAAVAETIREFDIALQPQAVAYASPLKIFEYMACGCAIVAPDQPNIREILTDGETGLLFRPDDPDALWRQIARLANDAALRVQLGSAAYRTLVARDYSWRRNAARIIAAADELRPAADASAAPARARSS